MQYLAICLELVKPLFRYFLAQGSSLPSERQYRELMANAMRHYNLFFLFLGIVYVAMACVTQGLKPTAELPSLQTTSSFSSPSQKVGLEHVQRTKDMLINPREEMIGSTAPICTYNECRRCRYQKCRAEQIPVEGNDPMNSAYHYRCVCHRPNKDSIICGNLDFSETALLAS